MTDRGNGNVEISEMALMEMNSEARIATAPVSQFQQGVPLTREALELVEEFQNLAKAVDSGFVKTTKPGDLAKAGVIFDITDSWLTQMVEAGVEETKVCFTLVEQVSGITHTVMQSDDSKGIRRKYATLYSRAKALGIPIQPLKNFRFVASTKTFAAGNVAYILERVNEKAVTA